MLDDISEICAKMHKQIYANRLDRLDVLTIHIDKLKN